MSIDSLPHVDEQATLIAATTEQNPPTEATGS